MNRIRLLPEHVANQIAAGEAVENTIDAQATRVTVEIQAGRRRLMHVTDNGLGMSRDIALLRLERHASAPSRPGKSENRLQASINTFPGTCETSEEVMKFLACRLMPIPIRGGKIPHPTRRPPPRSG